MAKIKLNFHATVDNLADGEQTAEEAKTNVVPWAKDAVDEFFADVQSNDATMYANMICSVGDANYQPILDSLPSGRQSSIMGGNSLYIRNEQVRHVCSDTQWKTSASCLAEGTCSNATYNNNQADCEANSGTFTSAGNTWTPIAPNFIINKGTIFEFLNDKQFNLAYHQILKGTAIKQMQHHQTLSPTSSRANLITKRTNERTSDVAVFAADATASWNAEDLSDPSAAADKLYQPEKKRLS